MDLDDQDGWRPSPVLRWQARVVWDTVAHAGPIQRVERILQQKWRRIEYRTENAGPVGYGGAYESRAVAYATGDFEWRDVPTETDQK